MAVKLHGEKWRADWRDEFHIRRRKDFDLKADAEAYEREMRTEAKDGKTGGAHANPNVRLNEFVTEFLSTRVAQGIDPGTVARQEIDLRRHILPGRLGSMKVRDIKRPAVRSLLIAKLGAESAQGVRPGAEKRTRKPLARGSVRSIYHTLSAVFSEAVEQNLIKANPIRGLWKAVTKGKARHDDPEVKAMTSEEASAFLKVALPLAPDDYPYFCTLMLAGLRPGEGLAVTTESINRRARTMLVSSQIGQHGGLKTTKTGEGRTVDLSRHLAAILADVTATRAANGTSDAKVVSISGDAIQHGKRALGPWLFYPDLGPTPKERDAQRVYKNALRSMRRCLEAAGLPTHFGLHSLRHTYGSGLISRGVSPAYVQKQMGHASIQQTVDTYGSSLPVRVPGAVDALGDAVLGGGGHLMDTRGGAEAAQSL
jgi:integrase